MSRETIFIVQPFTGIQGQLVAEIPIAAADVNDARTKARLANSRFVGVVTFSRTGDAETGDYEEPMILAKYGELPKIIADYLR